jgi:hypothetical protein
MHQNELYIHIRRNKKIGVEIVKLFHEAIEYCFETFDSPALCETISNYHAKKRLKIMIKKTKTQSNNSI